jgi:hypothetical protein
MEFCNEGMNDFRVKVAQVAADDYLDIHKILHRIDNGEEIKSYQSKPLKGITNVRAYFENELEKLMEYVYSDGFAVICPINVNKMLDILDKEFDEWKTEYDRKMTAGG